MRRVGYLLFVYTTKEMRNIDTSDTIARRTGNIGRTVIAITKKATMIGTSGFESLSPSILFYRYTSSQQEHKYSRF